MLGRGKSASPPFQAVGFKKQRPSSLPNDGSLLSLVESIGAANRVSPPNGKENVATVEPESAVTGKTDSVKSKRPKPKNGVDMQNNMEELSPFAVLSSDVDPEGNQDSSFISEAFAKAVALNAAYDLLTVRLFMEELIKLEEKSQNKLVVTWESVQERFHRMMSDDECPDEDFDLLSRYQTQMHFFQYSLDEKALEVWTGRKNIVELFSLPEFEGLQCFFGPRVPHKLLVMVDPGMGPENMSVETASVAVGTDDATSATPTPVSDLLDFLYPLADTEKETTADTEKCLFDVGVEETVGGTNTSTSNEMSKTSLDQHNTSGSESTISSDLGEGLPCSLDQLYSCDKESAMPDISDFCPTLGGCQDANSGSSTTATEPPALPPEPSCLPDPCLLFDELAPPRQPNKSITNRFSAPVRDKSTMPDFSRFSYAMEHSEDSTSGSSVVVTESLLDEPLLVDIDSGETSSKKRVSSVQSTVDAYSVVSSKPNLKLSEGNAPLASLEKENETHPSSTSPIDNQRLERPQRVSDNALIVKPSTGATAMKIVECDKPEVLSEPTRRALKPVQQEVCESVGGNGSQPLPRSSAAVTLSKRNDSVSLQTPLIECEHELEADLSSRRSVLEGLVFPEYNDDVVKSLAFIREAVSKIHRENRGTFLRMEDVLKELSETVSAKWVDYVLYFVPDVFVMATKGEVFLAWKHV